VRQSSECSLEHEYRLVGWSSWRTRLAAARLSAVLHDTSCFFTRSLVRLITSVLWKQLMGRDAHDARGVMRMYFWIASKEPDVKVPAFVLRER
jgi:hypothetical protein